MSQRVSRRYLITQSLLGSWLFSYRLENGYDDFLKTLRREPIKQTTAMLDGIKFENILNEVLNGAKIDPTHEWYKPITELHPILHGAQQQAAISKDITVQGINFVLYGKLDYLKAGVIYDTKFSKTYYVGKYLDSVQHPMYLALVPEAYEFQYKICDGNWVYTETYRPDETEPIERVIGHFMDFLDTMGLIGVYTEKWISKY